MSQTNISVFHFLAFLKKSSHVIPDALDRFLSEIYKVALYNVVSADSVSSPAVI